MSLEVSSTLAFHPSVVAAGLDAMGVWVAAASWSAAGTNDGWLPVDVVRQWDASGALASELIRVELWEREHDGSGYWMVPDDRLFRFVEPPVWRPRIPVELRMAVYDRDGWTCVTCGRTDDLTLDHIHPFSRGGPDTYENLQTMCRICNSRKGAR